MKRRVFLDTGVLIAAIRGEDSIARKAFEFIDDPDIEFASSIFVQLETIPKAKFFRKVDEEEFYIEFFNNVSAWADVNQSLAQSALDEASGNGLGAMDALHVVAAIQCGAEVFVTTEKPSSPIHRVSHLQIHSIAPSDIA